MTVINTNVGALMARTFATKANDKMQTSMERLSSGMRINSAADDAAGLAVWVLELIKRPVITYQCGVETC